jgi:amino acid adenylation domain-containing protein
LWYQKQVPNIQKLYQLLEQAATHFPNAAALVFQQQTHTYHQLNTAKEKLATTLSQVEIGTGDRVAIYTHKSIDFVVAQFAILKTGAAYLPIDANAPIERNQYIIENCEAKAIILHQTFYQSFKNKYTLVAKLENDLLLLKSTTENLKKSPPDLAYILYTSGSTGKPKGVMYSNTAALEFINWSSTVFSPQQNDCFSSHAPFHFDLSIFDLFVSIKHGAKLILIEEQIAKQPLLLAQLISEQKISIWYSTPTILNLLATYGKIHKHNYDSLRLVLFAGEVFPINQFHNLYTQWKTPNYYNLYGPTETNVCTYFNIPTAYTSLSSFPIGKVCEHYESNIIENELCISGNGIMLGYWQAEELNTNAFIVDASKKTWYKTGDIVERNATGELIFKGRKDRMVKRNGYRIELPEIEHALYQHPDIIEVAVIATIDEENATIITAFVNCKTAEWQSIIKMKEYCLKYLPVYMIPNNFMFLKSLPQTASNKMDYQKLKQLI